MKSRFIALLFIFLLLNQDIVINAHSLSKERHLLSLRAEHLKSLNKKKQINSISHRFHGHRSHSEMNSLTKAETKQLETLLIIGIVLVVALIISYAAKKIVDKMVEKEMKILSEAANKEKVIIFHERKIDNELFIDYCLGYQKISKLFKTHSIMAKLSENDLVETFENLKKFISQKGNEIPKNELGVYEQWKSIDLSQLEKFRAETVQSLKDSVEHNCYNAFKLVAQYQGEDVLGEFYTGFEESHFAALEKSISASKEGMRLFAGTGALKYAEEVLGDNIIADSTASINEIVTEGKEESKKYELLKGKKDVGWNDIFSTFGQSVASAITIKEKIKELKELIKNGEELSWQKAFKYLINGFEILENLFKGGVSLTNTLGKLELNFPFSGVFLAILKCIDKVWEAINAKTEMNEDKKSKLSSKKPVNPGLKMIYQMKKWDAFDSLFEAIQELSDMIMNFISAGTIGLSYVIKLSVKLFISGFRFWFSIKKLKRLRAMKGDLIKFMKTQTEAFQKDESDFRNILKQEKCTQHSTLLQTLLDQEFQKLDKQISKDGNDVETLTAKLTKNVQANFEEGIVEYNKKIVKSICEEDSEYCYEFLESSSIDKTFINSDQPLKTILKNIGNKNAYGPINSAFAVYKGIVSTKGPEGEDLNYGLSLMSNLIHNGYHPVFQSPRYDLFICRGCGDQKKILANVDNFLTNNELNKKYGTGTTVIQDSLQFANVLKKKSNDELAEYFVAQFGDSYDETKFHELGLDNPTAPKTSWIFWKRIQLTDERFRIPITFNEKPNLAEEFDCIMLFSVHQTHLPDVLDKINQEKRVNIIGTNIYMKKKKSDYPSHLFILAVAKKSQAQKIIANVCEKAIKENKQEKKCNVVVEPYQKDLESVRHTYKFMLYVNENLGDQNQLQLAEYINNDWFVMKTKQSTNFVISKAKEEVKVSILAKQTIQFQSFTNQEAKSNLDILKDLKSNQETKMGTLYKILSNTLCDELTNCGEASRFKLSKLLILF